MHSNWLYRGFLLGVLIAALWYSGLAGYRYYNYSRLTSSVRPASINWQIKEKAEDEFIFEASYTFNIKGRTYIGSTSWPKQFYRNRQAAEQDRSGFAKQYQFIWFNPNNPEHSSLQIKLPIKECVSAVILWGLFLYFVWLGFYVAKFKA